MSDDIHQQNLQFIAKLLWSCAMPWLEVSVDADGTPRTRLPHDGLIHNRRARELGLGIQAATIAHALPPHPSTPVGTWVGYITKTLELNLHAVGMNVWANATVEQLRERVTEVAKTLLEKAEHGLECCRPREGERE